ncbi:uncharacterized protein [Procambarus clarkii]|uniref:uncharacterized protein isoform X2 n=1 Tax=Procambarus clarkii TaxID=6728 RepID=UPI0037446DB3
MYPARGNTGRELFTRDYNNSNNTSSERWCQQLEGTQEWTPQVYGSQDSQRISSLTYRPPPPIGSSSQGGNSGQGGGGGQGGGRAPPAPPLPHPPDIRDLTLARDIRFGLHTILCVMQKLPDEVKEACREVSRASLQPEVTRGLIADTSNKLQQLVSDLQDKLTHLHATHNDQHSLSEEELGVLVSKVEGAVSHGGQQHVAAIRANITNDLRRHLKKMRDSLQELSRVEPAVKNLEEHFTQVAETITSSVVDLKTNVEDLKTSVMDLKTNVADLKTGVAELKHIQQEHPNPPGMDLDLAYQPSFDQVETSIKELSGKLSTFTKEVTAHFSQAIQEMGQVGGVASSTISTNTRLISPVHGVFSNHRPIFPLAECGHRRQVSPVAHVSPVPQVSPQVSMAPPASHLTPIHQPHSHTTFKPTPHLPPPANPTPTPISNPGISPSRNPSETLHYRPGFEQPSELCAAPQTNLGVAQPSHLRLKAHCRPDVAVPAKAVPSVTPPQDSVATSHSTTAPASSVVFKEATQGRPSVNTHKDRILHPKNNNIATICPEKVVSPEEDDDAMDDESQSLGCMSSWPQQAGTQRFTPPKIYTLIELTSDSDQEALVLDCDSSSNSDGSPMVLTRVIDRLPAPPTKTAGIAIPPTKTAGLPALPNNTDDWVESTLGLKNSTKTNMKLEKCGNHFSASGPIHQIGMAIMKKEIVTPNVRKTPSMVVGGPDRSNTVRSCEVVNGSGAAAGTVWGSRPGGGASEATIWRKEEVARFLALGLL